MMVVILLYPNQILECRRAAEIPGFLVSEPKHRDSLFESCLRTGLGIETQAWEVLESETQNILCINVDVAK